MVFAFLPIPNTDDITFSHDWIGWLKNNIFVISLGEEVFENRNNVDTSDWCSSLVYTEYSTRLVVRAVHPVTVHL